MKKITKIIKILLIGLGLVILGIVLLYGHRDIPFNELREKYAPPPSSFVLIEGMNVHYRDEGPVSDSLPIVLIHGTGASLHTFDAWADQLKTDRRVLRMDLPAYGLTGPFPDRTYSIDHYVSFVKAFLDKKNISSCVLAGNSLGGQISWSFTVQHPTMVDRLILIDAAGYPTKAGSEPLAFQMAKIPVIKNIFTFITPRFVAQSSIENVYADKSKITEELVDRYFELTLREGNRQAFVDRFTIKKSTNSFQKIQTIEHPTLILWGDQDQLIPIENAYRFQNDLPNDTLVILKDVGHVPMEEQPKESLEVVVEFMKKE
ncbi:MAG: alpha/beta hydrolase [Saprospiraceae bacterium]|nr:alpha/beta hydrolase [Saprospiraceae bacterium]